MKEYIERKATCKDCVHFDVCAEFWYSEFDSTDSLEETKEYRSDQAPCHTFKNKADVVEVRYGRWKHLPSGMFYCSECREIHRKRRFLPNYCHNCGAKMDGKGEG